MVRSVFHPSTATAAMIVAVGTFAAVAWSARAASSSSFTAAVASLDSKPLLSWVDGSSAFAQAFNPSFVVASQGTSSIAGLLVRSQNCSDAQVGGPCVACSGTGPKASVIAFSKLLSGGGANDPPVLEPLTASSVVYHPANGTFDDRGTEDPRIAYSPWFNGGTYVMFYTSYGSGYPKPGQTSVLLSAASTQNPTISSGWTRHGAVFPNIQGSKSAALVVPLKPTEPYYLLWGDTDIRIATSASPVDWPDAGPVLLSPRPGQFDSKLVEAGPPPLRLSNGDLFFLHNSANATGAYHPSWAILSGSNPAVVLARASEPLLYPTLPWEEGVSPYTCNVGNVVFLEASAATETPDVFRVYFGGADSVVGTATVKVFLEGQAGMSKARVELRQGNV